MYRPTAIKSLLCATLVSSTFLMSACGGGGGSTAPVPIPPPPAPPVNAAPVFSGASSFEFDEGETVNFKIVATDPEGSPLTFNLVSSDDFGIFNIDQATGEITGVPPGDVFDFENPLDGNADNQYNLTVSVSDGTNTVTKAVIVTIQDLDGPLTCSSGDRIEVLENTEGLIYTFVAEKEDSIPADIVFRPERTITRSGGGDVPNDFDFAISVRPTGLDYTVAETEVVLFHYLNAETLGNLDDIFTITVEAEHKGEITNCVVEIQVKDFENEVTSGVKLAGSYPDNYQFEHEEIGDIDGDGLTDFWLSSIESFNSAPWDHQGHVIFGKTLAPHLRSVGTRETLINLLTASEAIKISGSFPSVLPGQRFIGNTLISSPIGDIDGDGVPELLLALNTPVIALESAFADRPLAYLLWGDALLAQVDGNIDLNNLLPSEGIALEGLGGINRRNNTAISGDFDGDGIDDIAVRIPNGEIRASDTSAYRGQTFFVFGDYLRASKGVASIDLLGDVADLIPKKLSC